MPTDWLAIVLIGLVTFFTRVGGVGLANWIPQTPFWQRLLGHLPATLLVSIALPAFVTGNVATTVAAVVTLLVATARSNLVLCMAAGMATVALLRQWAL